MTAVSVHDVTRELRQRIGGELTVTKVHKLLFYVQAWSAASRGEACFPEEVEAFPNGPVVPLLRAAEKHGWDVPPPREVLDGGVIDFVVAHFGHLTQKQLIVMTHQEPCWQSARRAAGDDLSWLPDDPYGEQWRDGEGVQSLPISLDAMAASISGSQLFTRWHDEVEQARLGMQRATRSLEEDPERLAEVRAALGL